jgi:hypothetical protein
MYSGADEENIASVLCIAQRLVDLANSKPARRFSILTPKECIGEQETLIDMKRNKAKLFTELGKDKSSVGYLEYFFTYNPNDEQSKKKTKSALEKLKQEESSRSST